MFINYAYSKVICVYFFFVVIDTADAVILCLPDEASIAAASWVESGNDRTVLIDASTAFRVNPGWTYGFPEMSKEQRDAVSKSKRISNPGCYPTGFVGLIRPLTDAGILAPGTPLVVNAISGYRSHVSCQTLS